MNSQLSIIIILFIFFLIFIGLVFFFRSFVIQMFDPKISLTEMLEKAETNNSIYIEHKKITKKEFELYNGIEIEKNLIKISYIRNSYYKLITYSKDNKKFKLFWIKKTKCFGYNFMGSYFLIELLIGESLNKIIGTKYIEEKNIEKLNEIQNEYKTKEVLINNNCPACGTEIKKSDLKCNECGLYLSS
jgi:hypothetical protein